ncbi:MAG: hypothetical protein A4E35_00522 [Methanoregula sp. PtaU1.Bin051]|nr:MAG: hypothetical protein A4E35_00522 [Methanoregula sp. PtaU1.Bin051]
MENHIAVSDLVHCHTCPVRFYYEKDMSRSESDRYAVCKQVSYHLGKPLDPALIWEEVLAVRPGTDPSLREFLDHCTAACSRKEWKLAAENDVKVLSRKQGIVGMVDRVFPDNTFAIVRPSGALPFGISGADRLRIAAYALCLEEMTGESVTGGSVEHIPDGVSRFHTVQPRDRRSLVAVLRKVRAIREGDVPHRPLNAPCGRCSYKERCEVSGGHRLSEIL